MHLSGALTNRDGTLEPDNLPLTMVMVGVSGIGPAFTHTVTAGDVFAEPPDHHRNLPNDILVSDGT